MAQGFRAGVEESMNRTSTILRFTVSALAATAFVALGGGWLIHRYVGHQPSETVGLKVIRGIRLIAHVPVSGAKSGADQNAPTLTGFVQVGYTVGPDGRAHGIHVIRAVPAGHYEEAAREIIAARHFKPVQGREAELERTQVINFQVPATALEDQGQGGKS